MCYLIKEPFKVVKDRHLLSTVLKYHGNAVKGRGDKTELSVMSHVGVCYLRCGSQRLVALPLQAQEQCFRVHPLVVSKNYPRIDDTIDYGTIDKRRCDSVDPVTIINNFNIDSNNKIEYVFPIS